MTWVQSSLEKCWIYQTCQYQQRLHTILKFQHLFQKSISGYFWSRREHFIHIVHLHYFISVLMPKSSDCFCPFFLITYKKPHIILYHVLHFLFAYTDITKWLLWSQWTISQGPFICKHCTIMQKSSQASDNLQTHSLFHVNPFPCGISNHNNRKHYQQWTFWIQHSYNQCGVDIPT